MSLASQQFKFIAPWENEDWEHTEIKVMEFLAIYKRYTHFLLLKAYKGLSVC